ncbi:MAG: sugar phosphate isomerase/epimerase family protein [Rhizobiaceae bacterium]
MKTISLNVHSFSLRYHFRHAGALGTGYDVLRYMADMKAAGFTGVNISANGPGYRDLGGTGSAHFARVNRMRGELGLTLELDTSDTRPENMRAMIAVTAACGGDTLRTYTRYSGSMADLIGWTIDDLKAVANVARDAGVTLVLENHEDFQGAEIAEILSAVDHPNVRALYDYGNSQMVGEDPFVALEAMAPFIHRCHIKDHVLARTAEGRLVVQGVPMGEGTLPIAAITDRLHALGLRRFCFENVWSYTAPVKVDASALPVTPCFRQFGPERHLEGDRLDAADAVARERQAFDTGLDWFRALLARQGYRVAGEI